MSSDAIAERLLAVGAVLLRPGDPFTWASGLRAPIYCDNRLTLAHPALRRGITEALAERLAAEGLAPDAVAGVATAGIPQAALLAERLGLPMAYVRAAAKGHGRQNRIEGALPEGARVVLVEDLVSTGGSSLAAVEAVREAGATVAGVLATFTYGLPAAAEAFAAAAVPIHALVTLDDLLAAAHRTEALGPEALDAVRAWRSDPAAWSASRSQAASASG